jgi:hypothetical protein
MTWRKKAQNRAYKEALRHVPGAHASAAEVLEEATINGMTEQPPEAARLSMEQAIAWAKQHEVAGGPDWDAIEEGEFTEVKPEPVTNGAQEALKAARPHWNSVDDAVLWGVDQGAFNAPQHSQNAYDKLKREAVASDNPPKSAKDMFDRWFADVLLRLERAKASTITDAELDGRIEDEDDLAAIGDAADEVARF